MFRISSHLITFGLIGCGALAWGVAARSIASNPDLKPPLNPMGINRSPYGEVIAMAMQGSIDTYAHNGISGHQCGPDCDHDHDHDHDHAAETTGGSALTKASDSVPDQLCHLIEDLTAAAAARTNSQPITAAHMFYMRRQTEDKLRFAYNLDPAHYGNYNSYHLYLTTSSLGTRPELTQSAGKLAQETIDYCLQQTSDPRPALTASAAAENILELMFADFRGATPHYTTAQMEQVLALLDHCLSRYHEIAARWDATGNWQLLSPSRISEVKERIHFVTKIRESDAVTIRRFKQQTASNPSSN